MIDVVIGFLVSMPFFPFGWLLASAYLAFGDRWAKGTFGNRRAGIRVVARAGNERIGRSESFFRNLPWIFLLCVYQVPLWGETLVLATVAAIVLSELYLVVRLGVSDGLDNLMGNAKVIAVPGEALSK